MTSLIGPVFKPLIGLMTSLDPYPARPIQTDRAHPFPGQSVLRRIQGHFATFENTLPTEVPVECGGNSDRQVGGDTALDQALAPLDSLNPNSCCK